VLHPELKMAGRVVTAMYMPVRADIDAILFAKARDKGVALTNQWPIDLLQPGDVLVMICSENWTAAVSSATTFTTTS